MNRKLHGFPPLPLLAVTGLVAAGLAMTGCTSPPQGTALAAGLQPSQDALLNGPAEAELYLGIVDGIIKQGRYEAAIAFLDRYKKSETPTPRYYLLRGEALLGAKRYDAATAAFTAAAKSNLAPQAWCGLGRVEAARGHWDKASADFSRAADLDPANARYLNNLGYARLQQNGNAPQIDAAKTALERAYELDPGSSTIRNNLILAASLSNDHARLTALLAAIGDTKQRMRVQDFTKAWSPGHDDSAPLPEGGIQ